MAFSTSCVNLKTFPHMATAKTSKNYSTHLDATIELVNRDAGNSTTKAVRNVIDWVNVLSAEGMVPIATELEHLEDCLSEPQPDSRKIAESLEKLSRLTLEAAAVEEGAQGDKIRELAETLRAAAKSLPQPPPKEGADG
jgi:hypothetical protein